MKILFITHTIPSTPTKDGMSLIAHYLLKYLLKKHEITNLATDQFPYKKSIITHYLTFKHKKQPWFTTRHTSPSIIKMIKEEEKNFDLIYLHSPFSLGYLKHIKNTPVVVGLIDTMSDWFFQMKNQEKNFLKKWHYKKEKIASENLERELSNPLVKNIIVVSEEDKKNLVIKNKEKIQVITNGIDIDLFKPDNKIQKTKSIIFTGVMNYPPNVDAIFYFYKNIWPQLKNENLKWYIVGKMPSFKIKKLEQKDKNIIVTGAVGDIVSYLNEAMVYIAPLRLGTGVKNKILEAFACGMPVVALDTALGGLPDSPAIIASENDFAEKIKNLINDNSQCSSLGALGREYVKNNHNWLTVCDKYNEIFKNAKN